MKKASLLNLLKVSIVSTLLTLSLYGCATTPEEEDDDDLVYIAPEPLWKAEFRKLSNSQLQTKAVNALLVADESLALQYLEILLEEEPSSYPGLLLEKQINLPPSDTLGQRYVVYTSLKDETLMEIARRFTGERLKFYALARFNDIKVPGNLPEGLLLKVPNNSNQYTPDPKRVISDRPKKSSSSRSNDASRALPKPAKLVVSEPTPAVPAAVEPGLSIAEQANELYSDKRYSRLVALRTSSVAEFDNDPKLNDIAATSYLRLAEKALEQQNYDVASSHLAQAKKLDGSSGKLSAKTSTLRDEIQVGKLLKKAKSQEKQGDFLASTNTYQVVLSLDQGNRTATKQRSKLVNNLTKDYFQSSLKAREDMDYTSELSWLNKILDINPDYQKAKQRKLIVQILVKTT